MKTFEYFYMDGCIEFEALTQSWKEENKEKNIFRIKDVNDYEKLQTYTAKIVFLFNLDDTFNIRFLFAGVGSKM